MKQFIKDIYRVYEQKKILLLFKLLLFNFDLDLLLFNDK